MSGGLQKFMSRGAPPQQNDLSPAPITLDRRKMVAANARMPPPVSKAQANTQAKLNGNSQLVKLKASSNLDAKVEMNAYPPSSQKNISLMAAPVIPIPSAALGRTKEVFNPTMHSHANLVEESRGRGLFDESTYEEDSDETTTGELDVRDIYNIAGHFEQRVQPEQHAEEVADGHGYNGTTVSDVRDGHKLFAGPNGTKVSDFTSNYLEPRLESEQAFRGFAEEDLASLSDDEEFNEPGALNPPRDPANGKLTDRTGRFQPVQSGVVPSVIGNGWPEVPYSQMPGKMQEVQVASGIPNDEEALEDGIDAYVDHVDAQPLRNGKSYLFQRENLMDDKEIDMLDQNGRFDGSDAEDTESIHNSPTPCLPRSRIVQPHSGGRARSRKRMASELDYDEKSLSSMSYAELQNQPFEEVPNHQLARVLLPVELTNGTIEDRLEYFADKEASDQQQFFHQMSLEEWEDAGDWFLEQFGGILKEMKHARKSRREEVKKLEEELSERMGKVKEKNDGLDKVFEKMKTDGRNMLLGRTL